jgi:tetratricopeptide (TPR) repeat protein
MKSANKKQIAVISGSFILIVLLLFANTRLPKNTDQPAMSEHSGNNGSTILSVVENAKNKLNNDQKKKVELLEGALKSSPDKKTAFENMIRNWDSLRQPAVAAYYTEQAAIASPMESNWMEAGNRYYAATRFAQEAEKPLLFGKAIECFEKTIQINPKNADAKIKLGAC